MKRRGASRLLTREERIRNRWLVVLAALSIGGFLAAGGDDPQLEVDIYCSMVEQYKQTNGEGGWPAYKGEAVCASSKYLG
jgi:hypothetical protein